jgi:quercetin dioxygenase-like cupin family protein
MAGYRVSRSATAERIQYSELSDLQVLIGDEQQSTPIRIGVQTCQPGYVVPIHSHPYIEYLVVLEGSAEFQIESNGTQVVALGPGDAVELHPEVWHAFKTDPEHVTRLMGIHVSSKRIVNYKSGIKTDSRGFRTHDTAQT